jgi:hypothetical protein
MTNEMIDLAQEIPTSVPLGVPYWSENFCFDGFDHDANAGAWLHLGRWPQDPVTWREQILIFLPDGSYAIVRSFGREREGRGFGAACYSILCEEPGKRFRLTYRGPARRVTLANLKANYRTHPSEGPFEPLSFDLVFDSISPIWDLSGGLKDENWASSHYEQHGRLTGSITYRSCDREETVVIAGTGYRDHSRGPRELSNFGSFSWIHGQFSDGTAFAICDVTNIDDGVETSRLAVANVYRNGCAYPATIAELPRLRAIAVPPETYTLRLTGEFGVMNISARTRRTIIQSCNRYMDGMDGIAEPDEAVICNFEQPSDFVCNGITGQGWTERSRRLG